MKLVIFGANGPTGRLLTAQALAQGYKVRAFTRHPEQFQLRDDGIQNGGMEEGRLEVIGGDVFDQGAVDGAVAGADAVLSTLGVPFSRRTITLYSQGATNIIVAMKKQGVRRLVCVTSSATEPHAAPQAGFIFDKILQPFFIGVVGRTLYEDMRRMEQVVMASGLDWTIVRPSGLFETAGVTDYQMAEGHIDAIYTSRADLAACILQQLRSDRFLYKAVAVATVSVRPNLYELLWREGLSKKA